MGKVRGGVRLLGVHILRRPLPLGPVDFPVIGVANRVGLAVGTAEVILMLDRLRVGLPVGGLTSSPAGWEFRSGGCHLLLGACLLLGLMRLRLRVRLRLV